MEDALLDIEFTARLCSLVFDILVDKSHLSSRFQNRRNCFIPCIMFMLCSGYRRWRANNDTCLGGVDLR